MVIHISKQYLCKGMDSILQIYEYMGTGFEMRECMVVILRTKTKDYHFI
jgi:hypothetical protein